MNHHQKGILAWFASHSVAANLLMIIILISGAMVFTKLALEAFPALPPNSVEIEVSFDSSSASVAEQSISLKIEQALQGVAGIKSLTTIASGSGVNATVTRVSGYDLDLLYKDVKRKIDAISTFPEKALTPITTAQSYLEEAVRVHLWGKLGQDSLHKHARKLRRKLLADPAIDSVDYLGRNDPQIHIQLNLEKLQALGLSISDIGEKIAASSTFASAGELFSERGRLIVKANQQSYWQQSFANIIVKSSLSGLQIRLADIATIEDGYIQNTNLSRFNGQPAQGLIIKLRKHSDIKQISAAVHRKVAAYQADTTQDLQITVWADTSDYIQSRLDLLLKNSLQGVFLVMLLLALFLNIRLAFWVGIGLPVVFAGAALMMAPFAYDLSINELTTFGFIMALGIVVDDAVVVSESIYTSREKYGAHLSATILGVKKVSVPTIFGVLTTVVAFMSMTFIEGEMGKIFANFAYAAAFCLIFSIIESKLILPAHLANLKMQTSPKSNPITKFFAYIQSSFKRALHYFTYRSYRPFMHLAVKHKYSVIVCAITLLVAVSGMLPSGKVRFVFFPDIPSDTVSVDIEFAEDAPAILVQRQSLAIEHVIRQRSEQLATQYQLSSNPVKNLMLDIVQNQANLIIELSARNTRPMSTDQLVEHWRDALLDLEAVTKIDFVTSFDDGADIDIELAAPDGQLLKQGSKQIALYLANIPAVSAIKSSAQQGQIEYELALNPQGTALNLSLVKVIAQVQNAIQGYEVQRLQRNDSEVKVMLRYSHAQRTNRYDLERVLITDKNGNFYPLHTIANISTRIAQQNIYRFNNNRVANITANIDKNITSGSEVIEMLRSDLLTELLSANPELQINFRGEAEDQAQTTSSLQLVFIVALLVIYALLAIPLNSYFQPIIIMLAIPFGIIGAILGHWLHAVPISLLSLFGILALCGVVVNDSLLLLSSYNRLRLQGIATSVAVIHAACSRMRAIILTSSTTFIGLLPLIFETSEQAQFLIPAAISMGYGIVFATLITLIIVPVSIVITRDIAKLNPFNKKQTNQLSLSLGTKK